MIKYFIFVFSGMETVEVRLVARLQRNFIPLFCSTLTQHIIIMNWVMQIHVAMLSERLCCRTLSCPVH